MVFLIVFSTVNKKYAAPFDVLQLKMNTGKGVLLRLS